MKNYMTISLAISSIVLAGVISSSSAYAQNDSANLPGSSTNPVVEQPDPNKVIQKEKIPEQIKPMEDECKGEENNGKGKGKYRNHSPKMKDNCIKKDFDQENKLPESPAKKTTPPTGGTY